MQLPFSADAFLAVFAEYNHRFWPVVVLLWAATFVSLGAAWRDRTRWHARLSFGLAGLWLWNGLAYHALLFTRINPAAWGFALCFVLQALLFASEGTRQNVQYFERRGVVAGAGAALAVYSLVYPLLAMALGRTLFAAPTFGVPCPTAILTIGLLLTSQRLPMRLAIIPLTWSAIGGSAAIVLGVVPDYVLLGAGVLLVADVMRRASIRRFA